MNMKVKRFEAKTIKEAIEQVKDTLGPDAVILSVRKFGFLNRHVEVTAAADSPMISSSKEVKEKGDLKEIQTEIMELKALIEDLFVEKQMLHLFQWTKRGGLSGEIALKIIEGIKEGILAGILREDVSVKEFLYDLLFKLVKVLPPLEKQRRIAVFVGPTGMGKTTTLAKIAGNLSKDKSVGLITLDTRLGGSDLLRAYARLLELPIEVANSPKRLLDIIKNYANKDFILIDTFGVSPYNQFKIRDLARYLNVLPTSFITYLVISVTTKEEEISKIVQAFDSLTISSLLFTKIDEADIFGTIFNQMVYTGKPLSYLTTGQRVPEDIEVATPERVIDLIINTRGNYYDSTQRNRKVL